jgi:hypothetical protein
VPKDGDGTPNGYPQFFSSVINELNEKIREKIVYLVY